jgi:hypothetical protein
MMRTSTRRLCLLAVVLPLMGAQCQQEVQMPSRPPLPGATKPLQVLGVASQVVVTKNYDDAQKVAVAHVAARAPADTEQVIAVQRRWTLAHGSMQDSSAWESCLRGAGSCTGLVWNAKDRPWMAGLADVYVKSMGPVDTTTTPPTRLVDVDVSHLLSDDNGDDSWFGDLILDLVFLGPATVVRGLPGPPGKQGDPGDAGQQGQPGVAGLAGNTGATGTLGPRGAQTLVVGGGSGIGITGNAVRYESAYVTNVDATESNVQQRIPIAGTLSALSVRLSAIPTAALTFVVRKNAADTPVQCTAAGSVSCTSAAGTSIAFAAGDLLAIKSSGTSTVNPHMSWTAVYTVP